MNKTIKSFILLITAPLLSYGQTDIADARTNSLGSTVTVTGIVTNGSELGIIRYIEDSSAGIACYPGTGSVSFTANRGDNLTVTGELKDYNGLLEIDPITSVVVNSTGNTLPTPQLITPSQIGENTEGELIQIENVIFDAGCTNFTGETSYTFSSNGESGVIFVKSGSALVGALVPIGEVSLVAISSQFTYSIPANDGYQLLTRDLSDIGAGSPINFTSCVIQSNTTANGFDLSWGTDVNGSTNVRYGLTSALEFGDINLGGSTTSHSISLSGLNAASFYYVQAYSISGQDTAFSSADLYATGSASSGDIKVYFNNSVDHSVSDGTNAIELSGTFNDTISAYISRATSTIDLAIYNNSNSMIVDSINAAYDRGVKIRYVTESITANTELGDLNPGINVLYRPPTGGGGGIMHNKFIVIDESSTNSSIVLTGSTNFTTDNLFNDFNNLVIIQDQAIANAFTIEFEEMWGDTGMAPNASLARFGSDKLDNTPHSFMVNGKEVEVYFSPSDQTTNAIKSAINTVDYSMEFALLSFTRSDLGQAVIDANNKFGVTVKGIIENINDTGGQYSDLLSNGVDVQHHDQTHTIHHKYAIIDEKEPLSDPIVITGSHNWSSSAENKNDENTVFIHDANIANQFYQEFSQRYKELNGTASIKDLTASEISIFPNPAKADFNLSFNSQKAEKYLLSILDLTGKKVATKVLSVCAGKNSFKIGTNNLSSGNYLIEIIGGNYKTSSAIVIQ